MAKTRASKQDIRKIGEELLYPDIFAERWLGMKLYPKQSAALKALHDDGARVVFCSANGGGKTARVAVGATLWHMTVFPKGRVIHTSSSNFQIMDQFWPACKSHEGRFPFLTFRAHPHILRKGEPLAFYRGHATDDPGLFEGAHATDPVDGPLLVIYDEAKSIEDSIFQAGARFGATRELYLSSPGAPEGEFYQLHNSKRKFVTALFKQTADEIAECGGHPYITKEWIERMRYEWRGCPELLASMLDAEFMFQSEDVVFNAKVLDDCLDRPPKWVTGEEHYFCDFGGGAAENVLARRLGNKVEIVDAWIDADTEKAIDHFIGLFNQCGLSSEMAWKISGDATGFGHPIMCSFAKRGWRLNEDRMNASPADHAHYAHRTAEVWCEGMKKVVNKWVILPRDEELRRQLLARKKVSKGGDRITLESKQDMRTRGVPSPDRADAVLGCMMPCPSGYQERDEAKAPMDELDEEYARMNAPQTLAGADDGEW